MNFLALLIQLLASAQRSLRGWRLAWRALLIVSLGLALSVLVSAGDGDAGYAASPPPTQPATSAACTVSTADALALGHAQFVHVHAAGPYAGALDESEACAAVELVPAPLGGAPTQQGQVILVSVPQQWLWAYQDGRLVFATPVTTGQPALQTPTGVYHVTRKVANTTFYSPWPVGSPYYYAPLHINYALLFRSGGFYIHDAPWRAAFGPGTNVPHLLPDGTSETGSHGCVNVPTRAGDWLYSWANVGTLVLIVGAAGATPTAPGRPGGV